MKDQYKELYFEGKTNEEALGRLVKIVRILRAECPWDRVQTHETLTKGMLEESYEVVDAINNKDMINLREELGDVLLQVVFHGLLAEESGSFLLADVINDECDKMIRRHPHIFSEESIKSIDKLLEKWENIKSREHGEQSVTDRLKDVPRALPALLRSEKVQGRAAKIGFEWKDVSGAFDKLEEEIAELKEAHQNKNKDAVFEEFGDLLFSMVNVSRFLDINPEESLNGCTAKFIQRFEYMEKAAIQSDRNLEEMSLDEMDRLWVEAKMNIKK